MDLLAGSWNFSCGFYIDSIIIHNCIQSSIYATKTS